MGLSTQRICLTEIYQQEQKLRCLLPLQACQSRRSETVPLPAKTESKNHQPRFHLSGSEKASVKRFVYFFCLLLVSICKMLSPLRSVQSLTSQIWTSFDISGRLSQKFCFLVCLFLFSLASST